MAASDKNKRIVIIMVALSKSVFSKWQNMIGTHKVKGYQATRSIAATRELIMNLIIMAPFTNSIYSAHSSHEVMVEHSCTPCAGFIKWIVKG